MRMKVFGIILLLSGIAFPSQARTSSHPLLDPESFKHHIDYFNAVFEEDVVNFIPDIRSWQWLKQNIPFFECPDQEFERTYYYRWWTFRKHIKQTLDGFIVTEFLKPVSHATVHNAISCAFGHHIAEGRWLHDGRYLDEYIRFWLRTGPHGGAQPAFHRYSGWLAHAVYQRFLVNQDQSFAVSLLDDLLFDYQAWEAERGLESGLFWQYDVSDGMEESISGSRHARNIRPTINSYMYANAAAIAAIARMAGQRDRADEFEAKARRLKSLVQTHLWNPADKFFETVLETGEFARVREQIGFVPWYFDLPDPGYEEAWKELMDPEGFFAPYGPTTAERRHPRFVIAEEGDDSQWNGPSWPFSTAMTLTAMANLLNDYDQKTISKGDYFRVLSTYTQSHRRKREDGRIVPWIDENLHPSTGTWHARELKRRRGIVTGRGDHYNHSTYCDLIISGLVGLRPQPNDTVVINPLLPEETWDWFCLDNVSYHNRILTIVWDRTGEKYGRGKGLQVFSDGRRIAHAPNLQALRAPLGE